MELRYQLNTNFTLIIITFQQFSNVKTKSMKDFSPMKLIFVFVLGLNLSDYFALRYKLYQNAQIGKRELENE